VRKAASSCSEGKKAARRWGQCSEEKWAQQLASLSCPTLIADGGRQGAPRPVKRYLGEAQALTEMQVVQPRRASLFMAGKPPLGFSLQGLLLTMRHTQRLQLPHLRVTWARSGCAEMRECLRPEWGYGTWSSLTRSTRRWRNPLHKPNTQQHDRDNQPLPSQHLHQAGLWHNTRDPQHTRAHTRIGRRPLSRTRG
jgi:hypothetical protein